MRDARSGGRRGRVRSSVSYRGVMAASAPQLAHPTALFNVPPPLLAMSHWLPAGNSKAGKKPQEREREASVIRLL